MSEHVDEAVEQYRQGKVSSGKAAELAGMKYDEFLEELDRRGVKVRFGPETVDEAEEERKCLMLQLSMKGTKSPLKSEAKPSIFDREYGHELCPKCRRKNMRFGYLTDNVPRIRRVRVKETDVPIMFCPACGFYGKVKQTDWKKTDENLKEPSER